MLIHSFRVENYKGFREGQTIDLGSLTMLYGENSSGKSSLLRLLPWLSESMADERPGPVLDATVGREALWTDLAHVSSPSQPIDIAVNWSAGHLARWELRGGALPGSCELKGMTFQDATITWEFEDDGDGLWRDQIPAVHGMLPSSPSAIWKSEGELSREKFVLDIQWLQGIRAPVPRVEKALASPPGKLSSTGEGVARFLYQWARSARSDKERNALAFVLLFFNRLGFDLKTTDVAPSFFKLDVSSAGNSSAAINLVDTGEGLTQVLAPLVAMARAAYGIGPAVVCLEQPELHLHTDAQRVLALSIADAVAAGAQVVIETHSEVLLAATQLLLTAENPVVEAKDVALYWVARRKDGACAARRVTLDSKGGVSGGWPIDAFDDLLQLKSELLAARRSIV